MQQLSNIITIFKNKIFRIPDYQRGYAWRLPQLSDFWEDLMTLEEGKNHYMGVLTLEEVKSDKWQLWEADTWLIENKGYVPHFIVDGQQRLTTCIILLQAILEVAKNLPMNKLGNEDFELNDTKLSDIKRDFIFQQRSNGIQRSYIFGYEKDNPSYEFLKVKVFMEQSSSNQNRETLYTQNLADAKEFFKKNLNNIKQEQDRLEQLERIYKIVTRQLLFNEYIIQNDIDVFVAFETMNNRGKKLSDLELLKNRLIYLTTLFHDDENEKAALRQKINDAWKEIYYQLGRNKMNPLNDDDFLKAHWTMYFKYSRQTGKDYIHFLLDDQFNPKKVLGQISIEVTIPQVTEVRDLEEEDEESGEIENQKLITKNFSSKLTIKEIADYVDNIQACAQHWYNTFNPMDSSDLSKDEQKWLDRLNRVQISYFRPLVMSSFINKSIDSEKRVELFAAIERFIFIAFRLSQARGNYRSSEFNNASRELYKGQKTVDDIIAALQERLNDFKENGSYNVILFHKFIENKFKSGWGFYGWRGLTYFLFEYELYLYEKAKNNTQKITWEILTTNPANMVSIEHILPQTPSKPCWQTLFGSFSQEELNSLTNSLGNLLALSQPKNAALQNDCFSQKRADKGASLGYFNGSYSENRVAQMYDEWTPQAIKKRGIELLRFMEERWDLKIADDKMLSLLHLDFLP